MICSGRSLALCALLALAACDSDRGDAERETAAAEQGPHAQRLLFVGGSPDEPRAAVFVFGAERRGPRLARTARAWAGSASGWQPLLDSAWDTEPVREAWRPVPHGTLRLILRDDGGVAPVVLGENGRVRLLPQQELGDREEETPGLSLRVARLEAGGDSVAGAVLEERSSGGEPYDAYGLLTDGAGLRVVLIGAGAWVHRDADERVWREVGLERTAGDSTLWRLVGGPAGSAGELRVLEPAGGGGPDSLALVGGWLELGSGRQQVFGLLSPATQ